MGLPTSPDLRCPGCAAQTRPDARWCTLCYSDLRSPAEPAEVTRRAGGRHARPPASYGEGSGPAGSADAEAAAAADAMLEQLAAATHPALGALAARLESTGARVAAAVGGLVLVGVVLFALMAVAGWLL